MRWGRRRLRRAGALGAAAISVLALATVGATGTRASADMLSLAGSSGQYAAVIRRTDYGIPHILAANFGGLGYGYGYAFAQDNLCTLADLVLTADGNRSQYFGPDSNTTDPLAGPLSNLDSDVFHRAVNASGVVEHTMDQPAPLGLDTSVRQLINGYAAGVNRYLADTGVARLPDPTCRNQPWVRPITAVEIERVFYDINQYGGITEFQQDVAEATPGDAISAALPKLANADLGSNGIGVGAQGTANHDGLLLANPHFPWLGSGRFYQLQLTIPGVLDVTGASLYGTPLVEIGHNASLAWTHTVSTAHRFTLYQLHLAPGDPTSYLVDGKPERMTTQTVSVPVSGGGTESRTVYNSRYGPVLSDFWNDQTALAVKGASADNARSANEWLAMGEAANIAGLRAAQNRYQGIPFTNTIAADATGTAYYADASVVPHVTDAEATRCIDTPQAKSFYPNIFVLDGSTSDCRWGSSPDAIEPGIFGPSDDPSLTRKDFVTNSNDSFWLTNPAAPITAEPVIYGETGTARSYRTRLGISVIDERIAGTDGFGPAGFTVTSTERTLLSGRNLSADLARDATVSMCRANPVLTATDGTAVNVRAACAVLAAWDGTETTTSKGAVLWHQYWDSAALAPDLWLVPFAASRPATTPNTLNTAGATVRKALADAVERMTALHLPLDEPLSAAQYTTVGGPDIPVSGCDNTQGCYSVVDGSGSPLLGNDGKFSPVVFGSSFVMAVELSPHGTTAQTILTYSESTNPDSPHHGDQTALFSQRRWVTDRFTEHDIDTDPALTVTVLYGH